MFKVSVDPAVSDDNEVVRNQELLQLLSKTNFQITDGVCRFRCRLREVSMRHMHRSFRLKFELPGTSVAAVYSSPVLVKAKNSVPKKAGNKRKGEGNGKRKRETVSTTARKRGPGASKKVDVPVSESLRVWAARAHQHLTCFEWIPNGFAESTVDGKTIVDRTQPVLRCFSCGQLTLASKRTQGHLYGCATASLLETFPGVDGIASIPTAEAEGPPLQRLVSPALPVWMSTGVTTTTAGASAGGCTVSPSLPPPIPQCKEDARTTAPSGSVSSAFGSLSRLFSWSRSSSSWSSSDSLSALMPSLNLRGDSTPGEEDPSKRQIDSAVLPFQRTNSDGLEEFPVSRGSSEGGVAVPSLGRIDSAEIPFVRGLTEEFANWPIDSNDICSPQVEVSAVMEFPTRVVLRSA